MTDRDVASSIRRSLRALVALTLALYVVVFGAVYLVWRNSRADTRALCALRDDYQARADSGDRFLRDHPGGLPGIMTAGQIRVNITAQRRTVEILQVIHC